MQVEMPKGVKGEVGDLGVNSGVVGSKESACGIGVTLGELDLFESEGFLVTTG